jgi:Tropinone reductase 1
MARERSPWEFDGRRVLITGASRGIGRALLEECVRLGAEVIAVAREEETLGEAIRTATGRGSARAVRADATTAAGRATIIAALEAGSDATPGEDAGSLDVAFLNVGTNVRKPLVEFTETELDALFATNQRGTLDLLRALHPHLSRGRSPSVVLIGSVAGIQGIRTGAPYAMTKAALHQLARVLAGEWGPAGIRVNALAPWYTRTPLVAELLADPEVHEAIVARTPLGRIAEPEEVARAGVFLALPAASFVTGTTLTVDGGFCAYTW